MVKVRIWGSLQKATDNKEFVEVEAQNFKQLLDNLSLKYPKLKPQIKRGVSVAIDGMIYRNSWFTHKFHVFPFISYCSCSLYIQLCFILYIANSKKQAWGLYRRSGQNKESRKRKEVIRQ